MHEYEKLGVFYLGRYYDLSARRALPELLLYPANDLLTHALCVGMTGSGKAGLCLSLIEEAALDGIPAILIDPKGDLANLLLTFPDLRPEDLDVRDGVIFEKANPANRMTIADFIGPSGAQGPMTGTAGEPFFTSAEEGLAYPLRGTPPLFEPGWHLQRGCYLGVRVRFCRQAYFMEVEVDTETGQIDVAKVVTVNDVGKVINWDGCEGQAYGGAIMGIGRGMTEEVIHDRRTGIMLNGNLLNYKIPTMMDYGDIETIMVETGMGYGPYGTVGIGEDVATVLPALVGPAVQNALGVWIDTFPITPDKVLAALGKA